jgi:hypothetical protein
MNTQIEQEILEQIQKSLRQGDIKAISKSSGFSRGYVGRALSPSQSAFHENIVEAAIKIITARKQGTIKKFQKLIA